MRLLPAYCVTFIALAAQMVRAVPPSPPPLKDLANNPLPPVVWTHTFDFDTGTQGWTIDPGANPVLPAHWVDPASEPNGPALPDGQPSGSSGIVGLAAEGTGGGSLYLPGNNAGGGGASPESIAEYNIASLIPGNNSATSFVMQVDVYVANLLPLNGQASSFRHDGEYPGLHLEAAGFCALTSGSGNNAMCIEGAATNTSSGSASYNGYLRWRDFTGSAVNSWQFPTCCGNKTIMDLEGIWPTCIDPSHTNSDKTAWWDKWVTLYINYNYSKAGEVYAWAYIPWEHPNPNCQIAGTASGWIEIARRPVGAGSIPAQNWTRLQLGGRFSWTQGQWDNVLVAVHAPCHTPAVDMDGDSDVDMDDFGTFQRCYTGSNPPPGVYKDACRCLDRAPAGAPDAAIDAYDLDVFTSCFGRSGVPAPAGCEGWPMRSPPPP